MNEIDVKNIFKVSSAVTLVMLSLWFISDIDKYPVLSYYRTDDIRYGYFICEYGDNLPAFRALFVAGNFMAFVSSFYLGIKVYKIPSYFEEIQHFLQFQLLSSIFFGTSVFASTAFTAPREAEKFIFVNIICCGLFICYYYFLFYPKLIIHYKKPAKNTFQYGLRKTRKQMKIPLGDPDVDLFNEKSKSGPFQGMATEGAKIAPSDTTNRLLVYKKLNAFQNIEDAYLVLQDENNKLKNLLQDCGLDPETGEVTEEIREKIDKALQQQRKEFLENTKPAETSLDAKLNAQECNILLDDILPDIKTLLARKQLNHLSDILASIDINSPSQLSNMDVMKVCDEKALNLRIGDRIKLGDLVKQLRIIYTTVQPKAVG
eukprot:snap_masked-scaffold_44-processed-gene-1.6-mRNA-1 protein AED:1.00 eAED:1.00 QI:0/-1/0/0/-1/1/1/0/373